VSSDARTHSGETYLELQQSPEFVDLRRRHRKFVFPMAALFLAWYFLYVLLAAYAPDFMSHKVFGNVNVGILFGLGQFASTFLITILYVRWADREFDPRAQALHDRLEEAPR